MAVLSGVQADELARFLAAARGRRFQFGLWDCGMMPADWIQAVRGFDPAAEWRGRYRTALGLRRLLKRRGGLVAHFDACLTQFGLCRTDIPARGDIAVVRAFEGETGAIVLGPSWRALAGEGGVVYRTEAIAPILAAWGVTRSEEPLRAPLIRRSAEPNDTFSPRGEGLGIG